jgi:hypothetical protein
MTRRILYAAILSLVAAVALQTRAMPSTDATTQLAELTMPLSLPEHRVRSVDTLRGTPLSEPNAFAHPFRLDWVDSMLVVLDRQTDPLVRFMDPRTGVGVSNTGHAGDPYVQGAWVVGAVPKTPGVFVVFDSYKKVLSILPSPLAGKATVPREIRFGKTMRLTEVRPLANGTYFGTGFLNNGRYSLYDAQGRLIRAFGAIPGAWSDTIPYAVRQQAFLPSLATDPDGSRIASATQFADRLEIYSSAGLLTAIGKRPLGIEPIYATMRSRNAPAFMGHTDKTRLGFLALGTTGQHIYALFSGRTRKEWGRAAPLGNTVFVYEWNGHLSRTLQLDRDAIALAVDARERTLYTLTGAPTATLMKYDLGTTP